MNGQRILGVDAVNYYHVVSRIVDRRMVLGDREKRVFRDILRRVAGFCGVECVTFCLMSNHFHLLVAVRDGEHEALLEAVKNGQADAEMCRRVGKLYGKEEALRLTRELSSLRAEGNTVEAWDRLKPLVSRMDSLARFVRELKWRFSTWYNSDNNRVGTLWESRFRSVLIEGSGEALATAAAYIDLNPVRAGMVQDPKDYRFCGYAEALAGRGGAARGLRQVVAGDDEHETVTPAEVLARYRLLLFGRGRQRRDETGAILRRGLSEESAAAVERAGGTLPRHVLLRSRVRHLTAGAAVGSRAFLERLWSARREFFPPGRKQVGKPLRGGEWGALHAVRDVSTEPVSSRA